MVHSATIILWMGRLRSREEKVPQAFPAGHPLKLAPCAGLRCLTAPSAARPPPCRLPPGGLAEQIQGPVSVLFLEAGGAPRVSVSQPTPPPLNFTPAWPGLAQDHGSCFDSEEKRLWPLPGCASFSPPAGNRLGQRLSAEGASPAALSLPPRLQVKQEVPSSSKT